MSRRDSTYLLKPLALIVGVAFLAILVTLAIHGAIALQGDDGGQSSAGAGEPISLPGDWNGSKWYNEEYRDQEFKYKDPKAGTNVQFQPKEMNNSTLPENEHRRELIKYGRRLFANTSGLMPENTGGSRMSCANCHGGGSLPTAQGMPGQDIDMIPLVGTAAGYPEWTGRTERMRDMRQRIMGCFLRSMNADDAKEGVPAYDSREIQAMETYMVWLNKGTPSETVPYWRHIEKPEGDEKVPVSETNPVRGAELYLENCASCHGKDGQGTPGQFPPLWGPDSYNDGAGMGRLYTSAGFIREAMPYGSAHSFSDWEDVHDVAGFVNAHERPHLDRQPKDWAASGSPDEGIYYNRTQQRLGYDMNPMTKKLMLANIPIGTQPINQGMIPDDVEKYDQPMKDAQVDGSWRTTWINGSAASNATTSANETNARIDAKGAISDAMADDGDRQDRSERAAS